MKKFKYIFITIILFLLLSSPIKAKAQSFAIAPESLLSISEGLDSLAYGAYIPYGVTSIDKDSALQALRAESGLSQLSTTVTYNDFDVITSFDDMPYDAYEVLSEWEFCDNSNYLLPHSELHYGHFDNGYFSGDVIFDSEGNIVYKYTDGVISNRICNLEFGGSLVGKAVYDSSYGNISNIAKLNNYVYSEDSTVNGANTTYYVWTGYASLSGTKTESLFIANQYQPGKIMALNYQGWQNYICTWYANDLSYFQHTITGPLSSDFHVTEGDYTLNGIHYNYFVRFSEGIKWSKNGDYEEWIDDPHGTRCFASVGLDYSSDFVNYDAVAFNPADTLEDDDSISIDRPYGLDQVKDYVDALADNKSINFAFDSDLPISDVNYPISTVIDVPIDDSLPIPFEGVISVPIDAVIDFPLELDLAIPEGNFDVPIISGLQSHFPFSIPWDIKNMLKGLRSRPQAPNFSIEWYIRPIDYTWHFSLDLTPFNDTASLFRICFLISFIIGLCVFSYKHFFGS